MQNKNAARCHPNRDYAEGSERRGALRPSQTLLGSRPFEQDVHLLF